MIYEKIKDFCAVRNIGSARRNTNTITPRVKFIIDLLESEGIEYELDKFYSVNNYFYNIILRGNSNKMIVAHHDIVNPNIDNANDNSASVINVIATKKLRPNIHAVILDGEEIGGVGSSRLSDMINNDEFGQVDWVLNFELTGKGGKNFFIGDYPGPLNDRIKNIFKCPVVSTPYNDSVTIRRNGIDSTVINTLPVLKNGEISSVKFNGNYLDYDILFNCHNEKDSLSSISTSDMKEFVEEVILKILD